MISYMENHGLRVVPVCESLKPVGFEVINSRGETIFESKMLHEAETFIMRSKKERGITVGSAAEFKIY